MSNWIRLLSTVKIDNFNGGSQQTITPEDFKSILDPTDSNLKSRKFGNFKPNDEAVAFGIPSAIMCTSVLSWLTGKKLRNGIIDALTTPGGNQIK